jgi:membrane fusion protein, heavy metal efflux system
MKRLWAWIPNICIALLLLGLGVAIARPEWISRLTHGGSVGAAKPSEIKAATETFDDGWCQQRPLAKQAGEPCELPVVKLESSLEARRIGIQTAVVEEVQVAQEVRGNAESAYDQHVFADVIPRVRGVVRVVNADHGTECQQGTVLAVIDSAEVGSAKAEYLAALPMVELAEETHKRTLSLSQRDAVPKTTEIADRANLNKTRATLLNAEQRLRNFGFGDEAIQQIVETSDTTSLLNVVSPIEGTVVELHAVVGEALEPTTVMFQVTDLSKIWVFIDVPEREFDRVAAGQPIAFQVPDVADLCATGAVEWIDPAVNPVTRTVRVLGILDNTDRKLRANLYGRASIVVAQPRAAILVASNAVQRLAGGTEVVFLPIGDAAFRAQRVETHVSEIAGKREVTWGLKVGDVVVTEGSFPLLIEMRRDELAGD